MQFLVSVFILAMFSAFAQSKPMTKASGQSVMDGALGESMKGLSEEAKTEMPKMMKGVMPGMEKKPGSDGVSISDNKKSK